MPCPPSTAKLRTCNLSVMREPGAGRHPSASSRDRACGGAVVLNRRILLRRSQFTGRLPRAQMNRVVRRLAMLWAALTVGATVALPTAAWSQPRGSLDPRAAAAGATTYRSAFEGYRSFDDAPVGDWRALNEEVTRVGGHAGAMKHPAPSDRPPLERGGARDGGQDAPASAARSARSNDPGAARAGTPPTGPSGGSVDDRAGHRGHHRQ